MKTVVPPRRDIGPRVGARTHTRRGEAQRSTRSEAESCADGLSWHNDPAEGNYVKKHLGRNGTKWNGGRNLICERRLLARMERGIHNHRFGKKLRFCHFTSCSHHEFTRVLRFFPIRYQPVSALCCEFCPQIGHTFWG